MDMEHILNKVMDAVNTKTVIGDPIEIAGLTLVPVMNVSFGFGGGSGDNKNDAGQGAGGGGGARLKVAGVLVVKDGDIKFVQTGKGGTIDKLLDSIPDFIDKVSTKIDKSKQVSASDQ